MITKTTGFLTSDGTVCATLGLAQRAEVLRLMSASVGHNGLSDPAESATQCVMDNAEVLLGILALTPRSKPKARKQPGTTNPKRAVRAPKAAPEAGFEAAHAATEAS